LLLHALILSFAGDASLYWANRGHLPGGIGSLIGGSILLSTLGLVICERQRSSPFPGTFALIIALAVIARQDQATDPLTSWSLFSILVCCSFIGAGLASRRRWLGECTLGLLGGLAFGLLAILSIKATSMVARITSTCIFTSLGLAAVTVFKLPILNTRRARQAIIVLTSFLGSWLLITAIDVWQETGILDVLGLLCHPQGVFSKATPPGEDIVVQWATLRVRGLLAGAWLLALVSSALELWRYSRNGDNEAAVRSDPSSVI
jgi:hypothetical protein